MFLLLLLATGGMDLACALLELACGLGLVDFRAVREDGAARFGG